MVKVDFMIGETDVKERLVIIGMAAGSRTNSGMSSMTPLTVIVDGTVVNSLAPGVGIVQEVTDLGMINTIS